jgi:hypothetical protein
MANEAWFQVGMGQERNREQDRQRVLSGEIFHWNRLRNVNDRSVGGVNS